MNHAQFAEEQGVALKSSRTMRRFKANRPEFEGRIGGQTGPIPPMSVLATGGYDWGFA
jgi:hypothetical protein